MKFMKSRKSFNLQDFVTKLQILTISGILSLIHNWRTQKHYVSEIIQPILLKFNLT